MKSRFLVHKTYQHEKHIFNCSVLADPVIGGSEKECHDLIRSKLSEFLATRGREWVDSFKGDASDMGDCAVNCPDSYILLPLDAWHCKHDEMQCNLAIDIRDENHFLTRCRSEKKVGIFQSVKNKRYDGFHHVAGRYLCPLCDKNLTNKEQSFKYHYPWEVYPLWDCVDFDTEDAFWAFRDSGLPRAIANSKICARCFVSTIGIFCSNDPDPKDFFVVEMDFFPR